MPAKPVICNTCQSGMRRISVKREFSLWRCEACGAQLSLKHRMLPTPDPRIAKPQ